MGSESTSSLQPQDTGLRAEASPPHSTQRRKVGFRLREREEEGSGRFCQSQDVSKTRRGQRLPKVTNTEQAPLPPTGGPFFWSGVYLTIRRWARRAALSAGVVGWVGVEPDP